MYSLTCELFTVHAAGVPAGEDLPVLGVPGPDRAAHQLSKPLPSSQPGPLPARLAQLQTFQLENFPVSFSNKHRRSRKLWRDKMAGFSEFFSLIVIIYSLRT